MNGNNIAKWLGEMSDRSTFVREFNDAAKKYLVKDKQMYYFRPLFQGERLALGRLGLR